MLRSLPILVLLATVACLNGDDDLPSNPSDQQACIEEIKDIPVQITRDIDILFVIDTSATMAQEQASLSTNYRRLMSFLEQYPGGMPNIHVGVISSDLGAGPFSFGNCTPGGDGGKLQTTARSNCTPPNGEFLSNIGASDGTDILNYDGSLQDAFACIAELGSDGCQYTQPLEAMRRALDGSNPANAGFLRDDAFLMVVFVTDQDDCSASDTAIFDPDATGLGAATSFRCFEHGVQCDPDTPQVAGDKQSCVPRADSAFIADVDQYVDFLKGLKPDPNMVVLGAIIGGYAVSVGSDGSGNPSLEPSCSSATGEAAPAPRLGYLLEQFPLRNSVASMCEENQAEAFLILTPFHSLEGPPCMLGELDLDPDEPGVQYECIVSEIRGDGTSERTETLVPECETVPPVAGQLPCWYFDDEPGFCPDTPTGLYIRIERGRVSVPSGSHGIVRCAASICEPETP